MKLPFPNIEYVTPPGSMVQILSHPINRNEECIELALFNDHRYAFFYWNKWTQKLIVENQLLKSPCLISFDWHQDLMFPDDREKKWLDKLNLLNNVDVSLYAWANLTPINDGQIMAAAYLNIIGDIYVLCRQGIIESDWEDEFFIDRFGNKHTIKKFKEYKELENYLLHSGESNVYFDIDLDFFTLDNPLNGIGKNFTYLKNKDIIEMLSLERPLIKWIFERVRGFTIAIEPEHTGGLLKANKLLSLIDKLYFNPSLFQNHAWLYEKNTKWKHHPKEL
jgi:hypothetical protein